MKNYEDMSDGELSVSVFEVAQIECEHYHIDDGVVYKTKGGKWLEFSIKNPSSIMPIAIEHGFSIEIPDDNLGCIGTITKYIPNDTDIYYDYDDKDKTYRAIAICFLKMKELEK